METKETQEKKIQQYKLDAVEELKDLFAEAKDYIFTNYRGLTVDQITDLRNKLREQKASYKVVKNRFAKIAFQQLDKPDVGDQLTGPTAVALSTEEAGPVAKILFEFAQDSKVEVKGGIVEGQVLGAEEIQAFSKLPTKMELIAMLMSTMNAPVQNLVYAMNGVTQKLVRTLQAVADQKAGNN